MAIERIHPDTWRNEHGHIHRYRLAAQHITDREHVLDAACGIAYGSIVLHEAGLDIVYTGIDRPDTPTVELPPKAVVRHHNLDTWTPTETYDVALCFETLEHVHHPVRLADTLTGCTRRLIIVSVPTVPTKHFNPYHLHDFTPDDVPRMFPACALLDVIPQPEELSHIYILAPIKP